MLLDVNAILESLPNAGASKDKPVGKISPSEKLASRGAKATLVVRRKRGSKKLVGCTDIYTVAGTNIVYYRADEFIGVLSLPMAKANGQPQATVKDGNRVLELVSDDGARLKIFVADKHNITIGEKFRACEFSHKDTHNSCVLKKIK